MNAFVLSFLIGFFSGLLFFHHLFLSARRAILKRERDLRFRFRFLFLSLIALFTVLTFGKASILFLPGFYLSRLTYSLILLRIGSRDGS